MVILVIAVFLITSCEEAINFNDSELSKLKESDNAADSLNDLINSDSLNTNTIPNGDSIDVEGNDLLIYLETLIDEGRFDKQGDSIESGLWVKGYDTDDPQPGLIIGKWELDYYFINGLFSDSIKQNKTETLIFNLDHSFVRTNPDSITNETGCYYYLAETYNKIAMVNSNYTAFEYYVFGISSDSLRIYYIDKDNDVILDCTYKK